MRPNSFQGVYLFREQCTFGINLFLECRQTTDVILQVIAQAKTAADFAGHHTGAPSGLWTSKTLSTDGAFCARYRREE